MDRSIRTVALGAALAAALALGIAFVSERWGGLVPCALCLLERWPYRVIVVLGLAASLLPLRPARIVLWLILLPLLAAIALGVTHVGVEQGVWPSPLPECAAPTVVHGGSIADRMAAMPARPAKPCDEPTFLIPGLPVSMAAMNLFYALGFAIVLSIALLR
ncbi:MAG: disulfide bond formation protein B, partial [Acetobacteraceae bacterium]|nr:disulfide bond formation protein B [Acetobacteraceae bacterium]